MGGGDTRTDAFELKTRQVRDRVWYGAQPRQEEVWHGLVCSATVNSNAVECDRMQSGRVRSRYWCERACLSAVPENVEDGTFCMTVWDEIREEGEGENEGQGECAGEGEDEDMRMQWC